MRRSAAFLASAALVGGSLLAGVAMPTAAVAATSGQNLENYQVLAPPSAIVAGSSGSSESGDLVSLQRNYGYQENGDPKTTPAPLKMTPDWENKNNEDVSMHGIRQAIYDSSQGDLVTGKDQRRDGQTDDEVRKKCDQYNDQSGPFGWFNAVNDFFAETVTAFDGPSCAAYELKPQEDYETELPKTGGSTLPNCLSFGECGWPNNWMSGDGGHLRFHTPEFVSKTFKYGNADITRKTGWVIPVEVVAQGPVKAFVIQMQTALFDSTGGKTISSNTTPASFGDPALCSKRFPNAGSGCIVLWQTHIGAPQDLRSEGIHGFRVGYQNNVGAISFAPMHYPTGGTPYESVKADAPAPGTAPQSPVVNNVTNNYYTNGESATCTTRDYRESDALTPTPCTPIAPDDWVLERTENYQQTPGGAWTGEKQEAVTTPEYQEWKTENPECGATVCVLDLVLVGTGSCFNLGDRCDGWASDPDKGTKYQCLYGTKDVGLLECELYSRTFNQANRDGGFAYGTDIVPVASISTPPVSQPQEPPPGADGDTPVSTPTPTPTPGYTPPPGEGGTQGGHADPNGDGADGCWPTGWAMFNPVEWVLKPVRCAFEPDEQVVKESFDTMRQMFEDSSLWGLLGTFESAQSMVLDAGGCDGPELRLSVGGAEYVGHPMSACAEPLASFAGVARTLTGIAAWVLCAVSISNNVGGIIGFRGIGGNDVGESK